MIEEELSLQELLVSTGAVGEVVLSLRKNKLLRFTAWHKLLINCCTSQPDALSKFNGYKNKC